MLDGPVEWWMIAIGFALAEIFVVHIQLHREHHSFSLSEVPLVVGLFFVSPALVLPARLLGALVALRFYRRQSATKLVFNLCSFAAEVGVATAIFNLASSSPSPVGWSGWQPAIVAGVAAAALSAFDVTVVVRLVEGEAPSERLARVVVPVLAGALMNTVLGLVTVALIDVEPVTAWLVVVLATMLFVVYASYGSLLRRHQSLELLHAFTREVGTSIDADPSIRHLLEELRRVVKAEVAELAVEGADGVAMRHRLDARDRYETTLLTDAELASGVWELVVEQAQPVRIGRGGVDGLPELARRGIDDALVAPVHAEGRIIGHVLVGNRIGGLIGFDDADLRLFESMANHASVALQNSRLVRRLRDEAAEKAHQAVHDALTRLPNRVLFHERVEAALAASGGTGSVAVLLIDLDRFKEVNDTLGHQNGDRLLEEVSVRLLSSVRLGDTVARLGGDEFGILIPEISGVEAAVAAARTVLGIVSAPVLLSGLPIDVGASIGVAVAPAHGDSASALLQRADVAMYVAKSERTGVEVYDAASDHYSPERLSLAGELRHALEEGQLEVLYQLKADLAAGVLVGAEALVRWAHPERGLLDPSEFVPMAEHSGLVRDLSRFVLDEAVRQCAAWRTAGHDVDVSVNLSMRDLLDPDLPHVIAAAIARHGLPATALTVEMTESVLMSDVTRSIAALLEVTRMGVAVSVDDFGVGYSSLAYLQQLPVREIKIDRGFVEHLAFPNRDALVKSIIDLGRNLGLRVVAEGIEDEAAWDRLAQLRCDQGQGYWLARPATGAEVARLLEHGVRSMRPRALSSTVVPLRGRSAFGTT